MNNVSMMSYTLGSILFVINMIIWLITAKKIKQNNKLAIVSLITMLISYIVDITNNTMSYAIGSEPSTIEMVLTYALRIIPFIIQIIVFIKFIINIKNNK